MSDETAVPTPARAIQVHDPDRVERKFLCVRYNHCLTIASNADWDGFHCNRCTAFRSMTELEKRADLEGIARLIAEIPKRYRPYAEDEELN